MNDAKRIAKLEAQIESAMAQAGAEPVAWRITDGEGGYNYSEDGPELFNVDWSARYGRKYEPLYAAPTAQPAPLPATSREPVTLADVLDALNLFNRPKPNEDDGQWEVGHFIRVDYLPDFINIIAAAWFAPLPAREPLKDEQILSCVRSIGLIAPMGLTRDRGPYEVTEPTWYLIELVRAIEAAHGITATPADKEQT
jgi:hypothetical protein